MKIQSIAVRNFRGISDIAFPIEGKSTVFFGVNGVGKSSVLRAVNLLFSNLINKIVQNKFKQGINIELDDIENGKSIASVAAEFSFIDDFNVSYSRFMNRKNKERTHTNTALSDFEKHFRELYLEESAPYKGMPIFVNYGVNRAVLDVPLRIRKEHEFNKETAFQNAIQNRIDFRLFFEWFRNQEDLENQIVKETGDAEYKDKALTAVRSAMQAMLDGVSNIRVTRNPLAMRAEKDGVTLRIEQLSDGEKCTLALFGDLARRISIANTDLDDPLLGNGIVLIDEIELHMHTTWQRKILPALKQTFPHIQFIVTTHSPQVLGELDETYNVFALTKDENNQLQYTKYQTYGFDSNLILEELMNTPSVCEKIKEISAAMFQCIQEKKYEEALDKANLLDSITQSTNADTVNARLLIARGRQHEKNN
ncbi:MAG: AAA family ATPase [Syntrophomonadaceae bacterium]|nr:AAA family ATPase [Syntrophomonadaceae bacterium]